MKHSTESGASSHVLLGKQGARTSADYSLSQRERSLGRLAFVGGLALAVIGTTDVALLWMPPQFGNAEWEFATISSTLESLSLAALGYGLMTAGSMIRHGKATLYVLAAIFFLLTFLVLGAAALFALDVPLALRGAPPQLKGQIMQHFLKTGLLTVAYLFLFGSLGWLTLSTARSRREN
jgi:hypothetical protein